MFVPIKHASQLKGIVCYSCVRVAFIEEIISVSGFGRLGDQVANNLTFESDYNEDLINSNLKTLNYLE